MAQIDVVQNPELYQQKVTEAFFNALPILMKGEPVITIAPLSWKNAKGETAFNLSLLLKDPTANTEEPQTLAQEVDRSVKSLDAKLTIPVDMATEFMTQIAKIEGYQQEQAADLAKQQVNGGGNGSDVPYYNDAGQRHRLQPAIRKRTGYVKRTKNAAG